MEEQEIISLIKQGYKPRKKKARDKLYLTIRLGNSERSLGSYTSDLEDYVNYLYDAHKPADPQMAAKAARLLGKEKSEAYYLVNHWRASYMLQTCIHSSDGYCTFWRWEPGTINRINRDHQLFKLKTKTVSEDNSEILLVQPTREYCETCPVYKPRYDPSKPI